MGKTNKELAIDIAIEYAHGMLHINGLMDIRLRIAVR